MFEWCALQFLTVTGAVVAGLLPPARHPLSCLLLLQEREGLRQQLRGVEGKCREYEEALQCKICKTVSTSMGVRGQQDDLRAGVRRC